MQKPLVAILCITYNQEKFIIKCLEGIVGQIADFPFVAIVHDDASTDKTQEIISDYAKRYPNIILPYFETENQYRKGDGSLRRITNEAMFNTGAKYYATCEGDDYWTDPYKLQKQFDALEAHPECTFSCGLVQTCNIDGEFYTTTIPDKSVLIPNILSMEDYMKSEFEKGLWTFQLSSFMMKKEVLESYSKLKETLFKNIPYADIPLFLTALLQGKGYYINESLSVYRRMSGGFTSNIENNRELRIKFANNIINDFRNFNKWTEFKYNRFIKFKILREKFKIAYLSKNYFQIFNPIFIPLYKVDGLRKTLSSIKNCFFK